MADLPIGRIEQLTTGETPGWRRSIGNDLVSLGTPEQALTRAQAEQRLTDQALRDACSTPPDTSDDEITDMRRRLLDALFGPDERSGG